MFTRSEQEELDDLASALEADASRWPRIYKLRVLGLVLLGYGYPLFVVLLLAGVVVFLLRVSHGQGGMVRVALQLAMGALIALVAVLRALWIRIPAPEGHPLRQEDAPELFATIEHLRKGVKAPRVHRVLLVDRWNASVLQRPRLGLFGWPQNYLLIGLPILQALSAEEFRSILAHELGHLSGAHGRFGAWIYRIRQTWLQLISILAHSKHWGISLFLPFFEWYIPYFGAYSFVLARAQEIEADRCSVQAVGKKTAAVALVKIHVLGKFLDEVFWPGIFKEIERFPEPRDALHEEMRQVLGDGPSEEHAAKALAEALSRKADSADTHPSLAKRLEGMGASPSLGSRPETTAAQAYLGSLLEPWMHRLDQDWKRQIAPLWRGRHRQLSESRRRLEELKSRVAAGSQLSSEEAWEEVQLVHQLQGEQEALALYEKFLEREPEHARALWNLGRLRLERNLPGGVEALQKLAADLDSELALPAAELLLRHFQAAGRAVEARQCAKSIQELEQLQEQAQAERRSLHYNDTFLEHALDAKALADITGQLRGEPLVLKAYLVRKKVEFFPKRPFYVLGLGVQRRWYQPESEAKDRELAASFAKQLNVSGDTRILILSSKNNFEWFAQKVPGSKIYERAS